jgi:magnesium-transporting ATPase (P-type)
MIFTPYLNNRIKLYCKGADTVICKRLANSQAALAEISQQQLEEFAKCGFRTLCMAEREVCALYIEIINIIVIGLIVFNY